MNAKTAWTQARTSLSVFLHDVGNGLLEVSHNTLALLGLSVVAALIFMGGRAELRAQAEEFVLGWLQGRYEERAERDGNILAGLTEPGASKRATALDPKQLNKTQMAVVGWLSKRYRVAPEPVSRLAQEAWLIAPRAKVDPMLIMAIIAIESSFNPFAQSAVGAQGLMQVMTRVHDSKFEAFGGVHATFDAVTNLKVGVQVLRECIVRAGGTEEGLRCYVGAGNQEDESSGYAAKVMTEYRALQMVAEGRVVPVVGPLPTAPAAAATRVALALPR